MSRSISGPNFYIDLVESKANCPHCNKHFDVDMLEKKWNNQESSDIKLKCDSCRRTLNVAVNLMGDFVAYKSVSDEQIGFSLKDIVHKKNLIRILQIHIGKCYDKIMNLEKAETELYKSFDDKIEKEKEKIADYKIIIHELEH